MRTVSKVYNKSLSYMILVLLATMGLYAVNQVELVGVSIVYYMATLTIYIIAYGLMVYMTYGSNTDIGIQGSGNIASGLVILLVLAFIIRIAMFLMTPGHYYDVTCFKGWAYLASEHGLSNFYTGGFFADYTPGYIYWLWLVGSVSKSIGILTTSKIFLFLIIFPALICDLIIILYVYKEAYRKWGESYAVRVAIVVALSPVLIINSSVWKQMDSILLCLLIIAIHLVNSKRYILGALVYGIAILVKPQALIIGPIYASLYIIPMLLGDYKSKLKQIVITIISMIVSVSIIFIGSLPFKGEQAYTWIVDKYISTSNGYVYATVNAANFWGLLGANWVDANEMFLFMPYSWWGIVLIVIVIIFSIFIVVRGSLNNNLNIWLVLSTYSAWIYTLGHMMHERYSIMSLVFLYMAFATTRYKKLVIALVGITASITSNLGLSLYQSVNQNSVYDITFKIIYAITSIVWIVSVIYLAYIAINILVMGRRPEIITGSQVNRVSTDEVIKVPRYSDDFNWSHDGRIWTPLDTTLSIALSILALIMGLIYLGTTKVPESYWYSGDSASIEIQLDKSERINYIWVYGGISEGGINVYDSDKTYISKVDINYDQMYRWNKVPIQCESDKLIIEASDAWIVELALENADGVIVCISDVVDISTGDGFDGEASNISDEQGLVPDTPSQMSGMYFDELYHGRSAYEHLQDMPIYESTHPPIGKLIIMIGIWIFGMNPFGWRVAGVVIGALSVLVLYRMARLIFRRSDASFAVAFLFVFDFMRFTQTRIATIDVFAQIFCMLMFYYMYRYYHASIYELGVVIKTKDSSVVSMRDMLRINSRKRHIYLLVSGVSLGLAIGTKWIGFYGIVGLAILYSYTLYKEYRLYYKGELTDVSSSNIKIYKDGYVVRLIKTLSMSVVYYIIIPISIYVASFIPYLISSNGFRGISGFIAHQQYMLNYHSTLNDTHPFESRWWQWLYIDRPVWYYQGQYLEEGKVASIALLGTPIIWWIGIVAILIILVRWSIGLKSKGAELILLGYITFLAPWIFVERSTFLYHYYECVPYMLMAIVYLVLLCVKGNEVSVIKRRTSIIFGILMVTSVVLFIVFYPVMSGLPVSASYMEGLKLLPNWVF